MGRLKRMSGYNNCFFTGSFLLHCTPDKVLTTCSSTVDKEGELENSSFTIRLNGVATKVDHV